MVWFWGKIWLRTTSRRSPLEQEKRGYIKGSFNVLINALEQALRDAGVELHVGEGPSALTQREDQSWNSNSKELSEPVAADAVVVTTPSPVLARLVPDLSGGLYGKAQRTHLRSCRRRAAGA